MSKKPRKHSKAWYRQRLIDYMAQERRQLRMSIKLYSVIINHAKGNKKDINMRLFIQSIASDFGVSTDCVMLCFTKFGLMAGYRINGFSVYATVSNISESNFLKDCKAKVKECKVLLNNAHLKLEELVKVRSLLDTVLYLFGTKKETKEMRKQACLFYEENAPILFYIGNLVQLLS